MGPKKRTFFSGAAFETTYAGWLAKGLDANAILFKTRNLKLPYDEVIDTIFPKVFKDVLIASGCVIQPPSQERPKYIIFWALLKNLLSFQAPDKLFGVFVGGPPSPGDDEASDVGDDEDDEEDDVEDDMSKFVLVHSRPDEMWKVRSNTLMASVVSKRCTPLLIVEVKAAVDVEKHLWQPLATALELAEASGTEEPVWVLLTDMQRWHFAKVQRARPRPQTKEQGAAAAAAAQAPTSVVLQDLAASLMRAKASLHVYSIQLYEHIYAGLTTYSSDYYKVLQQLLKIMYPGLHLRELLTRQDAGQEVINSQTESWVKQSLANAKEIADLAMAAVENEDLAAENAKLAAAAAENEDLAAENAKLATALMQKNAALRTQLALQASTAGQPC